MTTAILESLIACLSSRSSDRLLSISLSLKAMISFRSSSFIKWLRNVLRTSSPLKLGKTSYNQLREEDDEEEEEAIQDCSDKIREDVAIACVFLRLFSCNLGGSFLFLTIWRLDYHQHCLIFKVSLTSQVKSFGTRQWKWSHLVLCLTESFGPAFLVIMIVYEHRNIIFFISTETVHDHWTITYQTFTAALCSSLIRWERLTDLVSIHNFIPCDTMISKDISSLPHRILLSSVLFLHVLLKSSQSLRSVSSRGKDPNRRKLVSPLDHVLAVTSLRNIFNVLNFLTK